MKLVIPFLPPSVNACYRTVGKKVVKSAKLRAFEQDMLRVFDDIESSGEQLSCSKKKLAVTIYFHIKGKRNIDLDNLLKALLDSLEGVLFEDDSQITEIHAFKESGALVNQTIVEMIEVMDIEK